MKRFFRKMKRMDERILKITAHLQERPPRKADGAVRSSSRCRIDDVPHGGTPYGLCVVGRLRNRAECAACVRTYGGSLRGFRLLLDSSGVLRLQLFGQRLYRIREAVRLRHAPYPGEMVRACAWCRAFLPLFPTEMACET